MGRWFEIASNRPAFQADCFCTTAEYALVLQPDGSPKVDVKNSCNRGNADGSLSVAIGSATIPDANTAGKLTVQFGPFAPPETNYWIVALAEDYTWAVVSSKTRSPLYLLGRERSLPQSTIDQVVADLTARGFNTAILDFTVQNGCR
jgi:apolipoprotein D and lipocalin family protein